MIKKLLTFIIMLIVLWSVAACTGESAEYEEDVVLQMQVEAAQEREAAGASPSRPVASTRPVEPESLTVEIPEPSPLLVTEEGIAWIVPPAFEHGRISYCSQCGGFIDSERRPICPETGVCLREWGGGHGWGGRPPIFVYDPERHLFGEPGVSDGYDRSYMGMHPFDEAVELFYFYLDGLNIVQAVDSAMWVSWSWDGEMLVRSYTDEPLLLNDAFLIDEAFLGKFAVMYNGEFVTDFIFDGGLCPRHFADLSEWSFDAIAMSINGRWGTVDKYGNIVTPFIYDQITYFDWGRAVAVYNNKHGLIDRYGNILVPFLFDHIFAIDGKIAFAMYNGKYGIIDVHQTEANVRAILQEYQASATSYSSDQGSASQIILNITIPPLEGSAFVGVGKGVGEDGDTFDWYHMPFGFNMHNIPFYFIDIIDSEAFREWISQFGHTDWGYRDFREGNLRVLFEHFEVTKQDVINALESFYEMPMHELDALVRWGRYGVHTTREEISNAQFWAITYSQSDIDALFSNDISKLWAAFPGAGVLHNGNVYSPEWILNNISRAVLDEQIPLEEIERIFEIASNFHILSGEMMAEFQTASDVMRRSAGD